MLRRRALRARSTGSPAARIMRPAPRLGPCRIRLLTCRLARAGRCRVVLTLWPMRWRTPATLRSRSARTRRSPGLPIAPAACETCARMRFALARPRPTVARSESRTRLGGERRLGCCCDLLVAAMDTAPHKPAWRPTLAPNPQLAAAGTDRRQARSDRSSVCGRPAGQPERVLGCSVPPSPHRVVVVRWHHHEHPCLAADAACQRSAEGAARVELGIAVHPRSCGAWVPSRWGMPLVWRPMW